MKKKLKKLRGYFNLKSEHQLLLTVSVFILSAADSLIFKVSEEKLNIKTEFKHSLHTNIT